MPSQSYITPAEYSEITGREPSQATEARLRRASSLLDSRIGVRYTYDETTGRKLDLTAQTVARAEAVKSWVAWMVLALHDNDDSPAVNDSVTLGRFTVQSQSTGSRARVTLPDEVVWADEVLVDVGIVDLRVRISGRGNERWGGIL